MLKSYVASLMSLRSALGVALFNACICFATSEESRTIQELFTLIPTLSKVEIQSVSNLGVRYPRILFRHLSRRARARAHAVHLVKCTRKSVYTTYTYPEQGDWKICAQAQIRLGGGTVAFFTRAVHVEHVRIDILLIGSKSGVADG